MIRHKIHDAQLRKAAALVRDSMLAQLPEEDLEPVQLNRDFCLRMEKKEKRVRVMRQLRQQAAAAVLALVVGFGCLLTFNTRVRAAVVSWFKEMYDTYVAYHFPGERPEVLPDLEFTWLPDGIELFDFYDEMDYCCQAVYLDLENPEKGFAIDCTMLDYADFKWTYDGEAYITQPVSINGNSGEMILANSPGENHSLIWVDDEWGVVFFISSPLDPDVIVHIAESIVLSYPTK